MSSLLGFNKTPIGERERVWNIRFRQHYRNQFNCETLVSLGSHGMGTMRRYELRRLSFELLSRSISPGVRDLVGNATGHREFSAPPRPGSAHRRAERAARSGSCDLDIDAARRPYVQWRRRDGARPFEREFSAPPRQVSAHRRLERAARSGRCGPDIDASQRPYVLWHRRDGARPFERRSVPPDAAYAASISIGLQRRPQIDARGRAGRINPIPPTRASPRRSRRARNARHSHIES